MKQRPRIYYTESQVALMRERWLKGDSLQRIAQLFAAGSIQVADLGTREGDGGPQALHLGDRYALRRCQARTMRNRQVQCTAK
jgi:hypothetical protein